MNLLNYHSLLNNVLFGTVMNVVVPSGNDYTTSVRTLDVLAYMNYMRTDYTSGSGVVLGTGSNEVDYYDHALSGAVVTGYTYAKTVTAARDTAGSYVVGRYTIVNTGSNDITINEVGLLGPAAGNEYCLLDRKVLSEPITITPGGVGQLEYTVRVDIPYKDFSIDFNQAGVHGVSWSYFSDSPILTRLGESAQWNQPAPAAGYSTKGSSPFDSVMPWAGMKRYNVIDGEISFSEDDVGFSTTDYDTVVYIPTFYYAVQRDKYRQVMQWAISAEALPGFTKHPGSDRYIGRYHSGVSDTVYMSKSGLVPPVKNTFANVRSGAHAKGTNWWMLDVATWSALQLLYLVEFANWDSQAMLGMGQNSGAVVAVGDTDNCLYHTVHQTGASNQYRWIEDPFSNVRDFLDGLVFSNGTAYVGLDNTMFDGSVTNLSDTGVYCGTFDYNSITRYGFSTAFPWLFLPTNGTNVSDTYVPDKCAIASDITLCDVGGYYASGNTAGLFFLYGRRSNASTSSYVGSRLIYIP